MSIANFEVLEKVGQGSYASVFKVRRLTDNKIYALKQIKMTRLDQKSKVNALNEVRFLASFSSPNIIAYHEAFVEEAQGILCIVMEFAEGGDLMKLIQSKKAKGEKFAEVQIWKVLLNLLHGIEYLHERSILHRDIKPDNIFISNGSFKLGDLNVSRLKIDEKMTQTGTPYYASPEVWNNNPYDEKTDIWSIGCALYQMAALRPPFSANTIEQLFHEVTKTKQKPIPKHFSNELSTIIHSCLTKDPRLRPTVKDLCENWTVRMYDNLCTNHMNEADNETNSKIQLLKTINFPQNLSIKNIELPKSNYLDEAQIHTFRDTSPMKVEAVAAEVLCSVLKEKKPNLINNLLKVKTEVKESSRPRSIFSPAPVTQKKKQNMQSQKNIKRRCSPRTELSHKKLQACGEKPTLLKSKVRPFICDNQYEYKSIFDRKAPKTLKKKAIVEQLIRNQQKAFGSLAYRSRNIQENSLIQLKTRVDQVMRAARV